MNNDTYVCPRCGQDVKVSARYCMKCGALNYSHPDNANMAKDQNKHVKHGSGNLEEYTYVNGELVKKNKDVGVKFGNNSGNKFICFLLNFLLSFIIIIGSFLYYYLPTNNFESLIFSNFSLICIVTSIIFIYLYSIELLYTKMNEKWWTWLIPIYNVMVLSKHVLGNFYLGILSVIPVVGQIYFIVLIYNLGKKFNYNGLFTVLFFPLYIPFMGLGTRLFDNQNYIDGYDRGLVEKEYKYKKAFMLLNFSALFVGIIIVVFLNLSVFGSMFNEADKTFYVYASNKIVSRTKSIIKNKEVVCGEVKFTNSDGVYYFHYPDASKELGFIFGMSREAIEAYVKVEIINGEKVFFIALTDGKFGIEETLAKDVSIKSVVKKSEINLPIDADDSCKSLNYYHLSIESLFDFFYNINKSIIRTNNK